MPTIHYKLRVTLRCGDVTQVGVMQHLQKHYSVYARVYERSDPEDHMHIYLVTDAKENTIRTRLRELTGSCRGNKSYSLVKLEVDNTDEHYPWCIEYIAYMMKEGKLVVKGIPKDVIKVSKAYDLTVKEEIKAKKEKKKSRYVRMTESFDFSKWEPKEHPQIYPIDKQKVDYVIRHVLDFFKDEGCPASPSTLTQWVTTLMLQSGDSDLRELVRYNLKRSIYRD